MYGKMDIGRTAGSLLVWLPGKKEVDRMADCLLVWLSGKEVGRQNG